MYRLTCRHIQFLTSLLSLLSLLCSRLLSVLFSLVFSCARTELLYNYIWFTILLKLLFVDCVYAPCQLVKCQFWKSPNKIIVASLSDLLVLYTYVQIHIYIKLMSSNLLRFAFVYLSSLLCSTLYEQTISCRTLLQCGQHIEHYSCSLWSAMCK